MKVTRVLGGSRVVRFSGLAASSFALIGMFAAAAPGAPHGPVTNLAVNLTSVSADSPTDAWAAGVKGPDGVATVLHWDGTSWTQVGLPDPGQSAVSGLGALSSTDAWAVGTGPGRSAAGGLTLHWNGTNWAPVATPSPPAGHLGLLASVSALSASDAFAVGYSEKLSRPAESTDLALRWNGTSWASERVPSPSSRSNLVSVSADSPSDAWAIGNNDAGHRLTSFAEHWNGTAWTQVSIPNPGQTFTVIKSVSAVSSDDAWAVGSYLGGTTDLPLILHWDGSTWARVPSPHPSLSGLGGVSAVSGRDVWAVGADQRGTIVLHWNGTSWTRVPSPSPDGSASFLVAVSAPAAASALAVGCTCPPGKNGGVHTLVLTWNGKSWVRS